MINMLPTPNVQTAPVGPPIPGEKSDRVDLYAELFAALFSTPPTATVIDHGSVDEAFDLGPNEDGAATAERLGIPLFDQDQTRSQPLSEGMGKTETPIPRPMPFTVNPMIESMRPIEYLGPPIGTSPKIIEVPIGINDRNPIPTTDTCILPIKTGLADGRDPIEVEEALSDEPIIRTGDHEVEMADPLELPPANLWNQRDPVKSEIEVKSEVIEEITVIGSPEKPASIPSIVKPFRPTADNFDSLPKPPGAKHNETPVNHEGNLLETFTANVLIDARPREVTKQSSLINDPTEVASILKTDDAPIKKVETKERTEFALDTSGGEQVIDRPAPVQIPEAKLRRAILDQVGTNLNDLAKIKMEAGDKREIKIRLKPAELGTVEITLVKNGEGTIDARFVTDNPHTQHLLDQTLAQLRESLENSGMKVGSLATSCSSTFADTQNGGGTSRDPGSSAADTRMPLRTTFEEPPVNHESKANRLVNLRA